MNSTAIPKKINTPTLLQQVYRPECYRQLPPTCITDVDIYVREIDGNLVTLTVTRKCANLRVNGALVFSSKIG